MTLSLILALLSAFILGIAKAGIKGTGPLIVTLMALAYGAKSSTGIVLPLLVFADVLAVTYYNRHTQWDLLKKILPWMIFGVVVGSLVGKELPDVLFRVGMSLIILISVGIMVYWEFHRIRKEEVVMPRWLAGGAGFSAGFATMIGNLAGAFTNLYFLASRIPKNQFIGTAAWLYLIVNIFKLPFHIFYWQTITMNSLSINLKLIPAVVIGFSLGIKMVKLIPERAFRYFIIAVTAIGAIILLLNG